MPNVVVTAATRKGVFVLTSSPEREDWSLKGPFAGGVDINYAAVDPRDGRLWATVNNPWWGPQVSSSADLGDTWVDAKKNPRFSGDPETSEEAPWVFAEAKVTDRFWRIEPGHSSQPGKVYCGVAPAALFESNDGGVTWAENTALSSVPSKTSWNPSNGGLALHSIVVDRGNPDRLWVAISAGGVYRSDDGGKSWEPKNKGIRDIGATFDPNLPLYPEFGQCVHWLTQAPGGHDRLYLQTHLGTYRSDDAGDSWSDITAGLPSEFALAMTDHPHDPDTAFVAPSIGGELRCPPGFAFKIWRTQDAGATWEGMGDGLPAQDAFMSVYRGGLCHDSLDPAGIYVGTNTGQLYVSRDDGGTWSLITGNLPPISSVTAALVD
jgi:photosystem II stability/assembly factor-like uncharacterized protein